jgi:hypothetical protein
MNKLKENNYYKWSVEKGDYDRDVEATTSHIKKISRKKRIRLSILILLYIICVAAVSYLIISRL